MDIKLIKKELYLEGLGCANCAQKIENEVGKLEGVKHAKVDFVLKKLTIEIAENTKMDDLVKKAAAIATGIESEIRVIDQSQKKTDQPLEKNKILKIARLGIGAMLFLAALLFKFPSQLEILLYLTSYVFVGCGVLMTAIRNILKGQIFDENFLMAIASIGAISINAIPEGVAVMLFYEIGESFQDLAVERSRRSITDLMDIRPDYANIVINKDIKVVSPEDVKVGDKILIKPGERVPLDGIVVEGKSMIDTSSLTGESIPRSVDTGNEILSGSINMKGLLTVQVTKTFSESTVSKILDLVENASSKKAPTEKFITKFARYYTPAVVGIAAVLAVLPPFMLGASFDQWLYRALVFLVVSCPCALVISIPLGFFGGIGAASKNGILIKGGNYLEALNQVDTIVFDKTGTLTKGVFKVSVIKNNDWLSKEALLRYAAYAESYSNHPIALSILSAYKESVDRSMIISHEELTGLGNKVKLREENQKEHTLLVGNKKLMIKENIPYKDLEESGTIVYIAVDDQYAGYMTISDEIKEDSRKAIEELRRMGVQKLLMLTGDNRQTGDKVGKELGLDAVYSELLPQEKVEILEQLYNQKNDKKKLVFVGDGINDAPVLARADIGFAMGGVGSDAAIEAADVVIMTDEPSKISSAIKIARKTRQIVWQNIIFALGIKIIVLVLGAGGIATMWEAVFADVGVAVLAVLNATRVSSHY